jgi:hypothetical protein
VAVALLQMSLRNVRWQLKCLTCHVLYVQVSCISQSIVRDVRSTIKSSISELHRHQTVKQNYDYQPGESFSLKRSEWGVTTRNCRTSRRKERSWQFEADSYVVFPVLACWEGPSGRVESAHVLFPHGQKAVDGYGGGVELCVKVPKAVKNIV